jgi:hypothetical protein
VTPPLRPPCETCGCAPPQRPQESPDTGVCSCGGTLQTGRQGWGAQSHSSQQRGSRELFETGVVCGVLSTEVRETFVREAFLSRFWLAFSFDSFRPTPNAFSFPRTIDLIFLQNRQYTGNSYNTHRRTIPPCSPVHLSQCPNLSFEWTPPWTTTPSAKPWRSS